MMVIAGLGKNPIVDSDPAAPGGPKFITKYSHNHQNPKW
jgi:hypothetical protein